VVAQQPGTSKDPGIVLSGIVPPLADGYYTRTETGPDLASSLQAGQTVVLVHGDETDAAPLAQGARARRSSRSSSPTTCGTTRWSRSWSG
jgi:hypothetical protein